MPFSESEIILELATIFSTSDPRVLVGIGDDAAIISSGGDKTVITTDMAVENVHFRREWASAEEIGRKITAANLADIYAMGAQPEHIVVAIALTGEESMTWIRELAQGIVTEVRKCDVSVIGGDIVRGECIVISMAAIGSVKRPVLRSGARVGDQIVISDLPGWSSAGWFLLEHQINASALFPAASVERALAQFRAPDVRYADAIAMFEAHSLCDVSDGLMTQGLGMAQASGVKFVIDSSRLASHPDFSELSALAEQVGADIWDWIGAGGEDHVFLATGKDLPGFPIGEVVAGSGIELKGVDKSPHGFTHFNPGDTTVRKNV